MVMILYFGLVCVFVVFFVLLYELKEVVFLMVGVMLMLLFLVV